MENLFLRIKQLIRYAVQKNIIESEDEAYALNRILAVLHLDSFENPGEVCDAPLEAILKDLTDYAAANGLLKDNTVTYRDLFDTELMGSIMARPSDVIARFFSLYKSESPEAATDYFYRLCQDVDYIRTYRVRQDMRWKYSSEYGEMDITINLSKPEKDPKAIAAAKLMPQSGYPQCVLCHENEGYSGNVKRPARQNLRQIPLQMAGGTWYFQYSPYVYYNEHCIVLSERHTPMKIDRSSFDKLFDFLDLLPHYFIGSNADLPIVGGSILSHDHMQGGRYTFAMEKASLEKEIVFKGYEDITGGILKWPMSVIRLESENRARLTDLAEKILNRWRRYSDPQRGIIASSDGESHNTITPIARKHGGKYQLDLVLRCNITSDEHPLGVFHPHEELHHIKKENIGLIEVMGLAVLPARLKTEMEKLSICLKKGTIDKTDASLKAHWPWTEELLRTYSFDQDNTWPILQIEIGKVFVKVLEDAGVYKRDADGKAGFEKFINEVV